MKRILLILCLLSSAALGSWVFDSTDVVTITDSDTMNFPDANWAMAGWYKMTSNTGSSYRIIYAHTDWADADAHFV